MKLDYCSVEELASAAKSCGKTIGQIVLEEQAESMELTVREVFEKMSSEFQVMKQSVTDGLNPDLRSASVLSGGAAAKMHTAVLQGRSHFGSLFGNAMAMALAVAESNSCMGQIVAAPTAGSCGVLPAALISVMEDKHIDETDIVMALFTASAIGMVIAKNASISGAEGGCQAEIGTASAMAAGALTEVLGGSPDMVCSSVAIALKNILGLVCDPVAGLVEVPCIKRNAMGVSNAFTACELACAGITSAIPTEEVIQSMKQIGQSLSPTLRETAEGGLAATPTGCRLCKEIFGK